MAVAAAAAAAAPAHRSCPSSLGRCPGPAGRRPVALRSPGAGGGAASRATRRCYREVRSPASPASSSEDSPPSSFLSFSFPQLPPHAAAAAAAATAAAASSRPLPEIPWQPPRCAVPARGSGGIQTPLHNITTTARRDWRPRGGEARVSRAPIGHATALALGPRLREREGAERRKLRGWARSCGVRGAGGAGRGVGAEPGEGRPGAAGRGGRSPGYPEGGQRPPAPRGGRVQTLPEAWEG